MAITVNIEPNTAAEILKAVYDSNGNLSATTPSTGYEVLKSVFEPDGTGSGRLRISGTSSSGSTGTDYFVTGVTLNSETLEVTLNNGTQFDTDLSSINTDTNYFVTGQTLTDKTIVTTLNNGDSLSTDLSSLSANTESQLDFMVEPTTGTTYNIVPNNFFACEIKEVHLFTDTGTLEFTLKNDGTIIGGLDGKAVTSTGASTSVSSAGTFAVGATLSFTVDTLASDPQYLYGSIKFK